MAGTESLESIPDREDRKSKHGRDIPDRDFELFRDLVYQKSGIFLGPFKKARLVWKLEKRMKELGIASFAGYYHFVVESGEPEIRHLVESMCTHETHFFRESAQIDFFEKQLVPILLQKNAQKPHSKSIRIWSAGCATGEEAYTLAMLLLRHFPKHDGWNQEVIATDLSNQVLARACEGIWPIEKAGEIPLEMLKAYMLRGVGKQEGKLAAGPEIREITTFQELNLHDGGYPLQGIFDCIFCRNVLIYFSPEAKDAVIARLLQYLQPGGYLFLGHAETLHSHPDLTRCPVPAVYVYKKTGSS